MGSASSKMIDDIVCTETALFLDSKISGTVTYRKVKMPGKYMLYKQQYVTGKLVITPLRFMLLFGQTPMINVTPWRKNSVLSCMSFNDEDKTFYAKIQLEHFRTDASGVMEFSGKPRRYEQLKQLVLTETPVSPGVQFMASPVPMPAPPTMVLGDTQPTPTAPMNPSQAGEYPVYTQQML
eukprot:gnl/Dysnectes_brevis/842_a929_5707.p1 GENE.gnl/Dysnectes_brevis/842_a929_5707~~gnl/Dysnectes_brevis/842_a929_5707.p1  ORF type:complete len:180 (+),score=47.68 gnl/Dysnectes_brevis/842_a929_5707:70-609(+)